MRADAAGHPAGDDLKFRRATWLTFRRRRPGKVVTQLMGHAKVDTTINVYTQVLDGSVRAAADRVGELFPIVHSLRGEAAVSR